MAEAEVSADSAAEAEDAGSVQRTVMAIRYVTAGESHGVALVGILENVPAGLDVDFDFVNAELNRRMNGYGRSSRMATENDRAMFLSGVISGRTIGSPIAVQIQNADCRFDCESACGCEEVTAVRPGHADLSGAVKYGFDGARNVLERASARSTAMTVALGAVAKLYLKRLGIQVCSHTLAIGGVMANVPDYSDINARADKDRVRCLNSVASEKMIEKIDGARNSGDTLGGVAEIIVLGCKSGIGSYVSADKRLDGLIMRAVGCVPSVKAVEIGDGIAGSALFGSLFHDEIYMSDSGAPCRKTNRAGGIEGGMTNGEPIVVRSYFKPIPTLRNGLNTVDISSGLAAKAARERSDVCAVPSGGVVCEAAVALALAEAISDMLGGDSMEEVVRRYNDKESAV